MVLDPLPDRWSCQMTGKTIEGEWFSAAFAQPSNWAGVRGVSS
jgi:hypothetical protein